MWCFALKVSTELELLIEIGFFQYCGVLKRSYFNKIRLSKMSRNLRANPPPGRLCTPPFVPPLWGGTYPPPHGKISMANPGHPTIWGESSINTPSQAVGHLPNHELQDMQWIQKMDLYMQDARQVYEEHRGCESFPRNLHWHAWWTWLQNLPRV